MGSLVGGVVALVIGGGLAAVTVVGIVQSQSSTSGNPQNGVQSRVMDYGTNQ